MNDDHLQTLVAVADEGTFEAAARRLHITPSAVSQRIRALEGEAGAVVVQRSLPARPTAAGEILLRLGRQRTALQNEALDQLGLGDGSAEELPVAVNADSLATWFAGVIAEVATWPDVALRLRVEDQAHSSTLLRSGSVVGAVTADPAAVQGCSLMPLTMMRYLPLCAPQLKERHRKGRAVDLATMPSVRFNDRDDLQVGLLRARGIDVPTVVHEVPSSESFVAAVAAGLGWGMVPVAQSRELLESGELVQVLHGHAVDVQLYWQAWRLRTERLDRLGRAVAAAATA